jgi:uncharacterized protein YdaU (DUF1376 family)
MHYYQFNIADYRKDTGHLSMIENAIYRHLIDWYYLDESPIPLETKVVMRRLRLVSKEDEKALENVLSDFFEREDGWRHKRIDQDIIEYHAMAEKNKANGKLGGRPKKTQSVTTWNPLETQSKGNQEPLTNNHKPIKPKSVGASATRLPADWKPSEEEIDYCKTQRPDLILEKVVENFSDYWHAKGGASARKVDWSATWRSWVRNEKAVNQRVNGSRNQHEHNASFMNSLLSPLAEVDVTPKLLRIGSV